MFDKEVDAWLRAYDVAKAIALVQWAAKGEGNMAFWWWAGAAAFDRVKDAPNRERV